MASPKIETFKHSAGSKMDDSPGLKNVDDDRSENIRSQAVVGIDSDDISSDSDEIMADEAVVGEDNETRDTLEDTIDNDIKMMIVMDTENNQMYQSLPENDFDVSEKDITDCVTSEDTPSNSSTMMLENHFDISGDITDSGTPENILGNSSEMRVDRDGENDQKLNTKKSRPKRSYKCDLCGKQFTEFCSLKRHNLVHTKEKPFACDICGREFSRQESLKRHSRIHTGEKPYNCEVCGKSFAFSHILTRHLLIHTGEKPFECHFCGQHFTLAFHVTRHMLKHTGEKPYTCEKCGKEFTQQGDKKRHMLVHSSENENPNTCSICGRSFTQSKHLEIHIQQHNTDSLTCELCGRKFEKARAKKMHMNAHKRNAPQTPIDGSEDKLIMSMYSRHKKFSRIVDNFNQDHTTSNDELQHNSLDDKTTKLANASHTIGPKHNSTFASTSVDEPVNQKYSDLANMEVKDTCKTNEFDKNYTISEILEGSAVQEIVEKTFENDSKNTKPIDNILEGVHKADKESDCGKTKSYENVECENEQISTTHEDMHCPVEKEVDFEDVDDVDNNESKSLDTTTCDEEQYKYVL